VWVSEEAILAVRVISLDELHDPFVRSSINIVMAKSLSAQDHDVI